MVCQKTGRDAEKRQLDAIKCDVNEDDCKFLFEFRTLNRKCREYFQKDKIFEFI